MHPIKILIVDDHRILRNGIKLMLSQQQVFEPIIEEAEDGIKAIRMAEQHKFDVILLDINLPEKDGITVANYLKRKKNPARILALTMYKEQFVIKQMIEAGAMGYILKNAGVEELTKAITNVASFKKYYSNEVAQSLLSADDEVAKKEKLIEPFDSLLTKREKEILCLIANEYTNTEIAERLKLSKRTVDGYRISLLEKLKIRNTAGLVRYAIEKGIV